MTGLVEQGQSFKYINEDNQEQTFFNWALGEPNKFNGLKENFIMIDEKGQWLDTVGETKLNVFCYKSLTKGEDE